MRIFHFLFFEQSFSSQILESMLGYRSNLILKSLHFVHCLGSRPPCLIVPSPIHDLNTTAFAFSYSS